MGEYILLDGAMVKLGTCEDLFYTRYSDLAAWVAAGRTGKTAASLPPAHYLRPGQFRFRFPWPDEDGDPALYANEYDRGRLVVVPAELRGLVAHGDAWAAVTASARGLPALNVLTPCPQAGKGHPHLTSWGDAPSLGYLLLTAQKPMAGEGGTTQLWAIVRCPWCGGMARLSPAEAASFAPYVEDLETRRRLLAGYGLEAQP